MRASVPLLLLVLVLGCNESTTSRTSELLIFSAGSLSAPLGEIARAFESAHPNTRILIESSGSLAAARKITELHRVCDVFLSADMHTIDTVLIPDHARWSLAFTRNEMVIAYHDRAIAADTIDPENCFDILLRDDVTIGRCDPDSAPAGYRAVHMLQLAERHYEKPAFAERLLAKDARFMRSQEPELFALLETRAVDYILAYRTTAEQRGVPYVELPDEINLSTSALAELYAGVQTTVAGTRPNTSRVETGQPMVYGLTIPERAPNSGLAEEFVAWMLDNPRAMEIWLTHRQPLTVPMPSATHKEIPPALQRFTQPIGVPSELDTVQK